MTNNSKCCQVLAYESQVPYRPYLKLTKVNDSHRLIDGHL